MNITQYIRLYFEWREFEKLICEQFIIIIILHYHEPSTLAMHFLNKGSYF